MRADCSVLQLSKVTKQCFLRSVDLFRDFQNYVQLQVAGATSTRVRHPATSDTNDFAGLRAWVDVVLCLAFEAGDFNFCTENGLGVRNGNFADQIRPVSMKQRMFANADLDVEVAARSTKRTGFALIRQPQGHTGINASGNFDVQLDRLGNFAGSAAIRAFIPDDLAFTFAGRAGRLDSKKSLRLNDLTMTTAVIAGVG